MRTDQTIERRIVEQLGAAYLIADAGLAVRATGGRADILPGGAPEPGAALLDLFPELYGSEEALCDVREGRLERHFLALVNRTLPGGATQYLDLLCLPAAGAGGLADGLLVVVSDMTERGLVEQARVQERNEMHLLRDQMNRQYIQLARMNAELRRATQIKDEFLASMSHEVRTPLTAILGLAEILRTQIISPLSEGQAEAVRGIEESGRHLLSLINDFLDIAKVEAGRLELDVGRASVDQLCQGTLRLVGELAMRKRLQVSLQVDPRVKLLVIDERRVRQALLNLLSNAIKFTPSGGRVGLDVQGDVEEALVRLTVWDTGVGIAAQDIPRLFQPFSQISGDHQRDQTGSGLGLMLVARLVALHGGSVSVESEAGAGSRFTISLPWSLDEQERDLRRLGGGQEGEEPAPDGAPPVLGEGQTVLVVEDDAAVAALVAGYLRSLAYDVQVVRSGEEALATTRHAVPALVIMDVRLGGIDGLETIAQMRASAAMRTTPIVTLTALAMPGDRERCLAAGADVYLSKPVRLHRLATTIAGLLADASRGDTALAG